MVRLVGRFSCRDFGQRLRRLDSSEEEMMNKLHGDDGDPDSQETEVVRQQEGELTPIERFKRVSDERHGIAQAKNKTTPQTANHDQMTPMEHYKAVSKARHGGR